MLCLSLLRYRPSLFAIVLLCLSLSCVNAAPNDSGNKNQQGKSMSAKAKYKHGEVLVRFKSSVLEEHGKRNNGQGPSIPSHALEKMGEKGKVQVDRLIKNKKLDSKSKLAQWHVVKLPKNVTVSEALSELASDPAVEIVEPNYTLESNVIPNDTYYDLLWGMEKINAPAAWDINTGSQDIIVAVIDTGVEYDHPDLADNMWTNPGEVLNGVDDDGNGYVDDVYGVDFIGDCIFSFFLFSCTPDSDPMDDVGHGTHVAGTIGAVGNNSLGVTGVNWTTKIMAIRFLSASGGFVSGAINALYYAQSEGAKITNNSWGGSYYSQALYDTFEVTGQSGMLHVVAAGNNGSDLATKPHYPGAFQLNSLISVAATDRDDELASFSSYSDQMVHLSAPGVGIGSTALGWYYYASGTSMASPHVAGAAALIWSGYPQLSAATVKSQILDNVDPIPSLQGKTVTGGRLNIASSMMPPVDDNTYKILTSPRVASVVNGSDISVSLSGFAGDLYNGNIDLSVSTPNPLITASLTDTSLSLIAGSASSTSMTVSTTVGLPQGNYPIVVTAVDALQVERSTVLTLAVDGPSLSITSSTNTPLITAGQSAQFTMDITSVDGYAGDVVLEVIAAQPNGPGITTQSADLPDGMTITLDTTLLTFAGGDTHTVTATVNTSTETPAGYDYTIVINAVGQYSKWSPDISLGIWLEGTDLVVPSVELDGDAVFNFGVGKIVNVVERNQGVIDSSSHQNSLYFSTDEVIDETDTLLTTLDVSSVAAGGGEVTVSPSVIIPAGLTPDFYYLGSIADSSDMVVEFSEDNNKALAPELVKINGTPTADAGPDQHNIDHGVTVSLSGSGSDSDGTIASYSWSQVSGVTMPLNNANTNTATFVAPALLSDGQVLTFELTVVDDDGASATDQVTISLKPVNIDTTPRTIQWVDTTTNLEVVGGSIQRTAGSGWNSGGVSQRAFNGGGGVQYTIGSDRYSRAFGLSEDNSAASLNDIEYAFFISQSYSYYAQVLYIYERGSYKVNLGNITSTGEQLRIYRVDQTVYYERNGVVVYTSTRKSSEPLMVDGALYGNTSKLFDIYLFGSEFVTDTDRDGVYDVDDKFPNDAAEWSDHDGDGTGDNGDTDDDNDGMPDDYELANGFDPLDSADALLDPDGDGYTNLEEYQLGYDPYFAYQTIQDVDWQDFVYTEMQGDSLYKPVGYGWSAGAASLHAVAGDGGIIYIQGSDRYSRSIGLSEHSNDASLNDVEYGFYISQTYSYYAPNLYIYENGSNRLSLGIVGYNEELKVYRVGETIYYERNGNIVYTSTRPSNKPLMVDSSLYSPGAKLTNVSHFGDGFITDVDRDGVFDADDPFPNDGTEWSDVDGDGVGDNGDLDDDNDGMSDTYEGQYGFDPLDSADALLDPDGDGYTNLEEYQLGYDPYFAYHIIQDVTWEDLVYTEVVGTTLQRTSGSGWNAGGASLHAIVADGGIIYSQGSDRYNRMFGLSENSANATSNDIEYAFYISQSYSYYAPSLYVYENGSSKASLGTVGYNDELKIYREGTTVYYAKNGTVVYTSTRSSDKPLMVDSSIYYSSAKLTGIRQYADDNGFIVDTDRDGVFDADDPFPNDGTEWSDVDGDGVGDNSDLDDDNDGMPDTYEGQYGFDPLDSADALLDPDGDGYTNLEEYQLGYDPHFAYQTIGDVTWSNLVTAEQVGTTLQKSSTGNGWNSGGSSQLKVVGDGGLIYTQGSDRYTRVIGLSEDDTSIAYNDVEYGFYISQSYSYYAPNLYVYENGSQRVNLGTVGYNDELKIYREGTTVYYEKNGTVVYTSTRPSSQNLMVDASLYGSSAKLTSVRHFGDALEP